MHANSKDNLQLVKKEKILSQDTPMERGKVLSNLFSREDDPKMYKNNGLVCIGFSK